MSLEPADDYRSENLSEADTRSKLIDPAIRLVGPDKLKGTMTSLQGEAKRGEGQKPATTGLI